MVRRLLFINRVYPPAVGATGEMLAALAAALAQRGWEVTVLTTRASGQPAQLNTAEDVRVVQTAGMAFVGAGHGRRALAYIALYPKLLWRAIRLASYDVVVTKTDPPMQLVLGAMLRKLKRVRTVHWAQDIYPEVAEQLGVIAPAGLLAQLMRTLSRWALREHDHVIAVGRCMEQRLRGRGVPAEKVTVIPNWAPGTVRPIPHAENPFRTEHGLHDRFVVMYSGNMGLAHSFETILSAAAMLKQTSPEVLFLFIGEGPRLAWLKEQARLHSLDNVHFLPYQPRARLAESLSAADVHLVTMHERLCGLVVPSKVYGALAAGRPCLFLGPEESEVARLLREHQCGEVLPNPQDALLAERIAGWQRAPERCEAAGCRARQAVARSFPAAVSSFETVLRSVV